MSHTIVKGPQPIGQAWLRRELNLPVPPAGSESYVVAGARRTEIHGANVVEFYPRQYATDSTVVAHLRFALRHEALDLGVIAATMKAIDAATLEDWLRREPTRGLHRRAWFFFELFTGRMLDIPDARTGNYVEALDPTRHFVAERRNSGRHRVSDNLLGDASLCPTVRRTAKLEAQIAARIDQEARALAERYNPITLARANGYVYTERDAVFFRNRRRNPNPRTLRSFRVGVARGPGLRSRRRRRPNPPSGRDRRSALCGARMAHLSELRWRDGRRLWCEDPFHLPETGGGSRPDGGLGALDAPAARFAGRARDCGRGLGVHLRLHSSLRGRKPPSPPVPDPCDSRQAELQPSRHGVSGLGGDFARPATLRRSTRSVLGSAIAIRPLGLDLGAGTRGQERHGRPLSLLRCDGTGRIPLRPGGRDCAQDLKEELGFVAVFDRALAGVRNIVDMPDRRASLFVRLCLQNGGRLAGGRRTTFPELPEAEIAAMEEAVQAAIAVEADQANEPGVNIGIRT